MGQIASPEARAALDDIEHRRRQVAAEVGVPAAYWWAVAAGWVVLGVLTDVASPLVALIATFALGTLHAAFAPQLLTGRHGTRDLSVRADVVGRHLPALLLAGLVAMAAVTVGVAVLVDADGAGHPVTIASVIVALIILAGGPPVVAAARRRALAGAR